MPVYSILQVSEILNGKLHSPDFPENKQISSISIDSRTIFDPESTVFFALKSDRNDGHRFIPDLIQKGVTSFVVSDYTDEFARHTSCCFIVVPDTLKALQKLTAWHRSQFDVPVVGITGSNGKTIVKEWLFELLRGRAVIRSPKSYNSQVGVPLSVWNLSAEYELAIFEAGISKPDEMQNLYEIIRPTIGILTNIGEAHQENFASKEEKLREKLKLFTSCHTLIYCADHSQINPEIISGAISAETKCRTWSYNDHKAELYFRKTETDGGVLISTEFKGTHFEINVPFSDDANLENAGHCLAFMLTQGYFNETTAKLFSELQPVAMRLEMKEGVNNCLLINDYYNSDINSLQIALTFLSNHSSKPYLKKTVILSDIQQAGIPDEQLYAEVARLVRLNKTNRLIGIGRKIQKYADLFDAGSEFYESIELFLENFRATDYRQECILLKGARDFRFELISSALQKKYHQTILEIDLNAMVGNLNVFRSAIQPETKVMVMVKAFSYGSGMAEIARILQFHKADYLAVAVADEGIELRQAGIDLPIVVMNPEEHSFENMIEFRLEPNIYSEEIFDSFRKVVQQHAVVRYPVHLKLDTGMHRLGFDSEEKVNRLADNLNSQDESVVRSV